MSDVHLRFDCYGACIAGVNGHPQKVMQELGIAWFHSTPQSVGDQWWFWGCTGVPEPLPSYLSILHTDPMTCIGFGLSQGSAEAIVEHSKAVGA